jgi:hypothetical protein
MSSFLYASLMLFVVLPITLFLGRISYSGWIRLPAFIRYIFFLPISVLIGGVVGYILLTVAFRDFIFTSRETFWVTHIMPILTPAFTYPAMTLLVMWLSPAHERKITQGFLIALVAIHSLAWLFLMFASAYFGVSFWYDTTLVELIQSAVGYLAVLFLWKNLTALCDYKTKSLGDT